MFFFCYRIMFQRGDCKTLDICWLGKGFEMYVVGDYGKGLVAAEHSSGFFVYLQVMLVVQWLKCKTVSMREHGRSGIGVQVVRSKIREVHGQRHFHRSWNIRSGVNSSRRMVGLIRCGKTKLWDHVELDMKMSERGGRKMKSNSRFWHQGIVVDHR